ncbi:MAG: COPII coat Sec23p-Sfb3p heterodimer component [Vezdaea aestivalis]|nr:MAG: COPII coat Sec23p-Sfb3p heterodimer component [Vezdaea aestivalis]
MSDFALYHGLSGRNEEEKSQQVAPPQFNPQIAPSPGGYQQGIAPLPGGHQPGTTPFSPNNAPQQQGYFPPNVDNNMAGMTQQMGAINVGEAVGTPGVAGGKSKKKNRHAYHNLDQPAANFQAPGAPSFSADPAQQLAPGGQYINQPITPAMNQFPAGGGGPSFNQTEHTPRGDLQRSGSQSIQTGGTGAQAGLVDPDEVPSVPSSRDVPAKFYLDNVYPTMEKHQPPPAVVPFVANDQGNSSPKYARLTVNTIPTSAETLSSTGLPLGLLLQPLAPLQEGEAIIPVLDFGEAGPPRCRRCRAYINPFMMFKSGGNKFVCNMCTFPNEVPSEYFSPTTPSGYRVDREQRAELTRGTVEFMVPKEYWAKEPVGIRWLFLIDVSQEAINKGMLEAFCDGISNALYGEKKIPSGSKVGIITYDKEVHFYNLSAGLETAQMIVMPDLEDPFLPLSQGLYVDPYESDSIVKSLLSQLPSMFSQIKNPEPALLPALTAALEALAPTGGKAICSVAALPTWGPGRLFMRDDGKIHPAESEKKLFTTEHTGWKKVAEKMVAAGVGVDFFLAAAGGVYLDIATIGHVSAVTGGEVFHYPNFIAARDSLKLSLELAHTVSRDTGYQALMKVRCSNGLQVSAYHGNFVQHTFGADLELGVIDADKSIGVMFSYDGKLDPKLDAHFQCALLYTSSDGQRRVRCCNIVASVSESGRDAMRFVDQDAVVNIIAKEAATRMIERPLKEIRGAISEKTVDILAGYRKNFSGSHPPGQLVLPENLKEFSMYMLSLCKCRPFKGGHEPTDRRTHDMRMLKSMGAIEMSLYLYPRIIAIHNLEEEHCFPNENGYLVMPPSLRASFSRIENGGAYIIDNGQILLLWIHAQVSPHLLTDLFSAESLQSLDPFLSSLPVLETHLSAQVRNLLQYLSSLRGSKAVTVQLARQGLDGAEYEFARALVEDRNNEAQSYVDWLVHVHRYIQLEITGQRKKEDSSGDAGVGGSLTSMRPPYW